jgi:hypothetical protein
MKPQIQLNTTKRLFQLSLITVVVGLWLLGVAVTASADPDSHFGSLKGKQTCDDGTTVTKEKVTTVTFISVQIDPTPFPNFDLTVSIAGTGTGFDGPFSGAGVAVTKNKKIAGFHAEVSQISGQQLYLIGKFIVDPKTSDPDVVKTISKVFGIDPNNKCIFVGKLKTTIAPPAPPPP